MNFWPTFCGIQTAVIIIVVNCLLRNARNAKKRFETLYINTDVLSMHLSKANTKIEGLAEENLILRSVIFKIYNALHNTFGCDVTNFGLPESLLNDIIKEATEQRRRNERTATNISQLAYVIREACEIGTLKSITNIKNVIVAVHKDKFGVDYSNVDINIDSKNMDIINKRLGKVKIENITLSINGISRGVKLWV